MKHSSMDPASEFRGRLVLNSKSLCKRLRDIVRPNFTDRSGTISLERGWTLYYAGVEKGERQKAGVGLLIAPWFAANVLGA